MELINCVMNKLQRINKLIAKL